MLSCFRIESMTHISRVEICEPFFHHGLEIGILDTQKYEIEIRLQVHITTKS